MAMDTAYSFVEELLHLDLSITEMGMQAVQYIPNTLVNVQQSTNSWHESLRGTKSVCMTKVV